MFATRSSFLLSYQASEKQHFGISKEAIMSSVVANKFFWLALALLVPFVGIWIQISFLHAVVSYAVFGGMLGFFVIKMKEKKGSNLRIVMVDRDSDDDSYYVVETDRTRQPRRGPRGFRVNPVTGKKEKVRYRGRL